MKILKPIAEYLQAIRDGIKNGDKIIEALAVAAQVRNGEVTEEALAEILRRKDICSTCPYNSRNAKEQKTYTSSLPYEHCILCHCRIGYDDSKEYCLTCNCGITVWNEQHSNQQMEVKWTAFENKKTEQN